MVSGDDEEPNTGKVRRPVNKEYKGKGRFGRVGTFENEVEVSEGKKVMTEESGLLKEGVGTKTSYNM